MKIVFTGGGTAGHVTPNLALLELLYDEECHYIGSDGMERALTERAVSEGRLTYHTISAHKFRRKLCWDNVLLPFRLARSVAQAKRILRDIHPDVVFGKGGYVGLPVVIAAKKLHIPVVIHESDSSAGLANKLSARFADRYLSTFPTVKGAESVGALIRPEILHGDRAKGLAAMGFDGTRPILLVLGGSLGAAALNNAVAAHKELANRFDIYVITGKNKHMGCDFVKQSEFVSEIWHLFAAADVCLTRGGANALAELTLAETPFVAVPLAKESRGEQLQNAQWFADKGCGLLLREESLERGLTSAVNAAYDNRTALQSKQRALRSLYATLTVANLLREYGQKEPPQGE